jgi:outer membrane protein
MKKIKFLTFGSILLAVFFILSCTGKGKSDSEAEAAPEVAAEGVDPGTTVADRQTVYVNIDTLMIHYLMAQDFTNELDGKTKKIEAELSNKQRKFQSDVTDFQNKAQKGLETRARLAEIQQQLATDEQSLLQLGEGYRMQLAEEQGVMQRKVLQAIMDYLTEYNKDKGYQYILANSFGSNILYANPALDITASVLAGLNATYKAEKGKAAKP